jgi:hypothetical protein
MRPTIAVLAVAALLGQKTVGQACAEANKALAELTARE